MDLDLFLRTLWRYRALVAAGLVLAVVLAVVSVVQIKPFGDGPLLKYRQDETWSSAITLQVTEQGFPEGRTQIQTARTPDLTDAQVFAEPGRLVSLAQLYARLVDSAVVREIMREGGKIRGKVDARTVASDEGEALPLIRITGFDTSGQLASTRAIRQASAFERFIRDNQLASKVPVEDRIELATVDGPTRPKLEQGRSQTLPIVIFLSTMVVVTALALAIENVRQRRREPAAHGPIEVASELEPSGERLIHDVDERVRPAAARGGQRRSRRR